MKKLTKIQLAKRVVSALADINRKTNRVCKCPICEKDLIFIKLYEVWSIVKNITGGVAHTDSQDEMLFFRELYDNFCFVEERFRLLPGNFFCRNGVSIKGDPDGENIIESLRNLYEKKWNHNPATGFILKEKSLEFDQKFIDKILELQSRGYKCFRSEGGR